ncbi:MAG: delta-60 repeat domain-containing protein [Bacteroidota bacterium]
MKKIKHCLIVILLSLTASLPTQAQTYSADNSFGTTVCGRTDETQGTLPRRVFPLADGSVISVMGYSNNNNGNALVITKLSPTGSVVWTTGKITNGYFNLNPVNADYYNGKLFVCGFKSDDADNQGSQAWLGSFDAATGTALWQVLLPPTDPNSYITFNTAIAMTDGSGSVVVFGSEAEGFNGGSAYVWLQKYTSAGVLDNTYNAGSPNIAPGGCVFSTEDFLGNSILQVPGVLQSSGKIVVAVPFTSCYGYVSLLRFNTDGSIDNTFAGGGNYNVITNFGAESPQNINLGWSRLDLKLAASDKLRIAIHNIFAGAILFQFDSDGNLDDTFGPNGGGLVNVQDILGGVLTSNISINLSIDPATDDTYYFVRPGTGFGSSVQEHIVKITGVGQYDNNFQGTGHAVFTINGGGNPARAVGYVVNSHRFGVAAQTTGLGVSHYTYDLANSMIINSTINAVNTTLSVNAGTASCFTYQWYKDNVAIDGETGTSYTTDIPGNYYVVGITTTGTSVENTSNTINITPCTGNWVGGANGEWNNASNWCSGIPAALALVTIPVGVTVSISNADVNIGNLIIDGSLIITNEHTLNISGNITNNGSINAAGGIVKLNGSANQNIAGGNGTVGTLIINNPSGAILTSSLNITKSITFENVSNTTFASAGFLTLRSSASGSASVGQLLNGNLISGSVTVERFSRENTYRGWRLLAIPVDANSQTIRESWQEGATSYTDDPNPGYGTRITANTATAVADGFDAQTFGNSLLQYDGVNWQGFTGSLLSREVSRGTAADAWMIYIRGDRSVDTAGVITTPTETIIRANGQLYTVPYPTITIPANTNGLVGNILPSEIDFLNVTRGGGADNAFYVWDPQLYGAYGLGAYQTFSFNTPTPWKPVPGGGSYGTTPNTKVQSGMGFFVHATGSQGTIQLTEASKSAGTNSGGLGFRPSAPAAVVPYIETNLYAAVTGGNYSLADGNIVGFDDAYNNDIDNKDNVKVQGFGDGIGMIRGTNVLSAEQRKLIVSGDIIPYRMTNLKKQAYKLEIVPSSLNDGSTTAVLEDKYLNTATAISLDAPTTRVFNADPAVQASFYERFRIVFTRTTPVTIINVSAAQKAQGMEVSWKTGVENGVKEYEVERSADGNNFTKAGIIPATSNNGSSVTYSFMDVAPLAGVNYYRIKTVDLSGAVRYSYVIKVVNGNGTTPAITLNTTVITDKRISLQFTNQPKGKYGIRLTNALGQQLLMESVQHNGGNSTESFTVPALVSKGIYHLEIVKPNGSKQLEKVVVN